MSKRVGIVGAGPAGLAAALACAKLGLEPTVFERAKDFQRIGGGILIHSNGQRALEAMGLLDVFLGQVAPVSRLVLERPDGKALASIEYDKLGVAHARAAIIMRYKVQEILLDACRGAGVPVHFGRKCVGVEFSEGGTLKFEDGEAPSFDVLLGCDGIRSRVREAAGIKAELFGTGYSYLRAIAAFESPQYTVTEVWGPEGRRYGFGPLPEKQTYLYCTAPTGQWDHIRDHSLEEWLRGWAPFGERALKIFSEVRDWNAVNYDEVKEVAIESWCRPPLFLIGDAAHAMTPDIGQGTNAAMVDAVLVSRLLKSWADGKRSLQGVAQEYERVRMDFVLKQAAASRRVASIAGWSGTTMSAVRRLLLLFIRSGAVGLAAGVNPLEDPYLTPL
jgi:2-polyprenyl-6-methoxyphenol hydroxylase-like FAD-dependent oxidoreductase